MTAIKKTRAPFKKKEGPTPVDVSVGQRLRQRRLMMGFSQDMIAKSTGLTFQQIQKYEQGVNRVSASRLLQFCQLLNVEPNYFFESATDKPRATTRRLSEEQDVFGGGDTVRTRETAELIRIFNTIENPKTRKNFLKIIRDMAETLAKQDT